jgi:hypothetical protein
MHSNASFAHNCPNLLHWPWSRRLTDTAPHDRRRPIRSRASDRRVRSHDNPARGAVRMTTSPVMFGPDTVDGARPDLSGRFSNQALANQALARHWTW